MRDRSQHRWGEKAVAGSPLFPADITALLVRAAPVGSKGQFKSTVALGYMPVPYCKVNVNLDGEWYGLHVRLVDWSRLDPGVESLESLDSR